MSTKRNEVLIERGDFEKYYAAHADTIAKKHRVALADIAIYCGENIMINTRAACEKALELVGSGYFKEAMILNCASSQRWALGVGRALAAEPRMKGVPWKHLNIMTLGQGRIAKDMSHLRYEIERLGVDVILINSWEFASANARYREETLFALKALTLELNITIVVYSQAIPKEYKPGCIMRGTLGRLSVLAQIIGPVVQEGAEEEASKTEEHSEHFVSEEGHLNREAPVESVTREVELELVE
jgi:hypothetical protein